MPHDGTTAGTKKILIVEDEPAIVRLLKHALERERYLVCVAGDGEEALEKIEQDSPDLVILDLGLPKISGTEVCKTIRRMEKYKTLPIIMLTGKSGDVDRIIGKVVGADYYMTKPFAIADLIKTVAYF
jgi:DNA-binding response OmpR family regulator